MRLTKSRLYLFLSNMVYYGIAVPVVWVIDVLFLGMRITGREHLAPFTSKNKETGRYQGAILVSNHVHDMDCTMLGLAALPRHLVFLSLISNFKIPVAGWLIHLLSAVPVPRPGDLKDMRDFVNEMEGLLQKGRMMAIYPEGRITPYETELKPFKSGAFHLAAGADVPIIPLRISYAKGKGLWRIKRKPVFRLKIMPAIWPDHQLEETKRATDLRARTLQAMKEVDAWQSN